MKNMKYKVTIAIFILFLAFFSAGSFIFYNKDFSENENRYLQEFPKISKESIIDKTFAEQMEEYVSDRLTGRDFMIGIKNTMLKLTGSDDAGGVYFCSDGYYIEKKTNKDVDTDIYTKNLKAMKVFFDRMSENGIDRCDISFIPVPTASAVLRGKLPKNASFFDEFTVLKYSKEILSDYNVIDVTDALLNEEYAFYKTDHHWTSDSAFAAYCQWLNATGRNASHRDNYVISTVSDKFRGTLYSKVLCIDSVYDEIRLYTTKNSGRPIVICDGEVRDFEYGFWDSSFLNKKDKYAAYYGGNYALTEICTNNEISNGKNILIIKDSYANCFVPFLYEHFDNIYMIDLRFYNGNIISFAEEHKISDVLALYNISSFCDDKTIRKAGLN